MRMHINGVPVDLVRSGDRWEAHVGAFGLLVVCGATADETMRQVVALVSDPVQAAA